MKTYLTTKPKYWISLLLFALLFTGFKPTDDGCTNFYPVEEGTSFEITHYDEKDKVQSRTEYTVVENSSTGDEMSATIKMKSYDKKDKDLLESEFSVACSDGKFHVDIRSFMNAAQIQQMSSMDNMDVSVETEDLIFPSDMSVGDELDDGSLTMEMKSSSAGMTMMKMTVNIKNREVVGKESVTTPAGTYDCYIITSDVQSKMGFMNFELSSKDWIAEGVGMVKSESYRKGKLEGYSLLTKFD